jgi:hypothetical protein
LSLRAARGRFLRLALAASQTQSAAMRWLARAIGAGRHGGHASEIDLRRSIGEAPTEAASRCHQLGI